MGILLVQERTVYIVVVYKTIRRHEMIGVNYDYRKKYEIRVAVFHSASYFRCKRHFFFYYISICH